jgi:hypothetical protein
MAHLSLKRIWSKNLGESCNSIFLADLPPKVSKADLAMLHIRDARERRDALLAHRNAVRLTPCIKHKSARKGMKASEKRDAIKAASMQSNVDEICPVS